MRSTRIGHNRPGSAPRSPTVTTLLLPPERAHVDELSRGGYRPLHRDTLDDAVQDLRERRADAMLVSVTRCGGHEASRVAAVVREFPQTPPVAMLATSDPGATQTVLELGRSGIRTLVDVRTPVGWRQLRDVLSVGTYSEIDRVALARLSLDLASVPDDCWLFFESLFGDAKRAGTVRKLARALAVVPSTLVSRFVRARLPTPKRYLAYVRLMRAARLFENPGLSITAVANDLDYSSPQCFSRHVRLVLHMSATEFRRRYDGEGMVERFRAELILPYRSVLERFRPLSPGS